MREKDDDINHLTDIIRRLRMKKKEIKSFQQNTLNNKRYKTYDYLDRNLSKILKNIKN